MEHTRKMRIMIRAHFIFRAISLKATAANLAKRFLTNFGPPSRFFDQRLGETSHINVHKYVTANVSEYVMTFSHTKSENYVLMA